MRRLLHDVLIKMSVVALFFAVFACGAFLGVATDVSPIISGIFALALYLIVLSLIGVLQKKYE